jgi:hypothetical protein
MVVSKTHTNTNDNDEFCCLGTAKDDECDSATASAHPTHNTHEPLKQE